MQLNHSRLAAAGALLFIPLAGCRHSDAEAAEPINKAIAEAATKPISPAGNLIGSPLTAKDGMDALQQLTLAYRSQSTFRASLHADINMNFGPMRQITQDTLVIYSQNPARALMHITDPLGGTNDYFGDGRTLVHYRGVVNQYQRRTSPPGLPEISAQIDRDAPLLLSPLSFVTARDRPAGVESAKLGADETLDGHPVAVVSGTLSAPFVSRIGGPLLGWQAPVKERAYKLWIDRATSVVRKSEIKLAWLSQGKNLPNAPLPACPTVHIVEKTTDAQFGVSITTDDFRFNAPANSKEVFTAFQ